MTHKDVVRDAQTHGHAIGASTVLVLADDPSTCASVSSVLSGLLNCRVYQAETLQKAKEICGTARVNLVVLTPSQHDEGLRQLHAVLGSDRQRRVPIVVAVRDPRGGDHLDFLRAGADDAVSHVDSDAELLMRVSRRLAQERERETQAMARRYSLAGDLTGLGLTDLITVLEQSALTGSLELLTRRGAAQLLIRDGQIRYASFGSTRGRFAFFELLREREGQFEFAPGEWTVADESAALEGPNTVLLLEGSQAMDENPDEAPAVEVRSTAQELRRTVPALQPDSELAEEWLRLIREPASRGDIQLLARDQVRDWTSQPLGGVRLRLALVTDVTCGVHIISHLAGPLALEEIANSLRRPPVALGFTWKVASGQSLEILLLDQERLRATEDVVLSSPAVLILAPSFGDFLTYNMSSRATLQRLLRDAMPLAILGVGNQALEGHVATFLKLAKLDVPTRFLRGSLWKLEVTPRALLEAAIRHWAELPVKPRSRAA
jgi:DNA-binding response OmpR family regulator